MRNCHSFSVHCILSTTSSNRMSFCIRSVSSTKAYPLKHVPDLEMGDVVLNLGASFFNCSKDTELIKHHSARPAPFPCPHP